MYIEWPTEVWEDFLDWQNNDEEATKQIFLLIDDIREHPFSGIGDPEPIKYDRQDCFCRKINENYKLIYRMENDTFKIASCRCCYDK